MDDGDRGHSHRPRVGLLLGAHQPRLGSIRPGGGARRGWVGSGDWLSSYKYRVRFEVEFDDGTDRQQDSNVSSIFPFKYVGRMPPPGDYRVVTDEEVIEGLSFTADHRRSTKSLCRPRQGGAVWTTTINPMDLQAVHEQDVAMLAGALRGGEAYEHCRLLGAGG